MFREVDSPGLNVKLQMIALSMLASFFILGAAPASAAVDMFLKLEGINGESKDSKHRDEIDVLSWSWGMSNSGSMHTGGGGGAGKASFEDLTITKYVDKSTTDLVSKLASGRHIPEATLVVRKAGRNALEYIKIKLTDVIVTSISTGGSGGEDRLTENVTLNFAAFEISYVPQKKDGSGDAEMNTGWDIRRNRPK